MTSSAETSVICVEDRGSQTTLLVFAHRDAEDFAFRRVTADLGVNRVLVRDPTLRGWYNQGLTGVGDDVASVTAGLAKEIEALGSRRTLALGSSMGAYAAILFGIMLGAERVLAFNPQTLLDPIFPLTPPPHFPCEVRDLNEVVSFGDTLIDLVIAEEDCADLFHAAHLAGRSDVQVKAIASSTHLLTDELNAAGRLRPMIEDWLRGIPVQGNPLLFEPSFRQAVLTGVPAFLRGDYQECLAYLSMAERDYPDHPGLPHLRGCALFEIGRYAEAFSAQAAALDRRPGWLNAMNEQARALERCPGGW